jgi:hypothetical protein
MNKTPDPRILIGLLLVGLTLACSLQSAPVQIPETETPLPTAQPTETATLPPLPTETAIPATPTVVFAPVCEPGAALVSTPVGCQLPIAEERSTFCTSKVPYNLIVMNEGTTYQVLNEGFRCLDEGVSDGKQRISCTGPMSTGFQLRVCDPACAIPTVQAELTQCPQGYIFDTVQGCCTQELQPVEQGCIVLSLGTKSCVVNCGEFTNRADCEDNAYACEWNANNKTCQLRR